MGFQTMLFANGLKATICLNNFWSVKAGSNPAGHAWTKLLRAGWDRDSKNHLDFV